MERQFAPQSFSLIRWFSIVSLAVIAVVCFSVTQFLTHYLTVHMLHRDAEVSRDFLESILITEHFHDRLASEGSHPTPETLAPFVKHLTTLPDLARANLYGADATVLWSTNEELIGYKFEKNDELTEALRGEIIAKSWSPDSDDEKSEHFGLKQEAKPGHKGVFVESYLPLRSEDHKRVLAVAEIYRTPHSLFRAIDQGVYFAWGCGAASGFLLYLAFFGIVRHGDKLMQAQRERLIEAETMTAVGEMAGAVAHGIRNPLASIRSSAELAREEGADTVDDRLRDIIRQSDRLDGWVRELLITAQGATLAPEPIDLNLIVQEVLKSNAAELKRRGIAVAFEPGPTHSIQASRAPLQHSLESIITNAIQAMPDGGSLHVQTLITGDEKVRLTVEDTGKGISAEAVEKMFRPFFSTKPNGTGLGLALTRRILERHAGDIVLESKSGRGTRVIVTLPLGK